jgi:hypothetical protein
MGRAATLHGRQPASAEYPGLGTLPPTRPHHSPVRRRRQTPAPANYWAMLDLELWKKEGSPAHMEEIRNFPWGSLEDPMQYSVPNLNEATMA